MADDADTATGDDASVAPDYTSLEVRVDEVSSPCRGRLAKLKLRSCKMCSLDIWRLKECLRRSEKITDSRIHPVEMDVRRTKGSDCGFIDRKPQKTDRYIATLSEEISLQRWSSQFRGQQYRFYDDMGNYTRFIMIPRPIFWTALLMNTSIFCVASPMPSAWHREHLHDIRSH